MKVNNNAVNIEVAVMKAYELMADSATEDLRGAVDRIEANNTMKAKVRDLQKAFETMKSQIRAGNYQSGSWTAFKNAAKAAGFQESSDLIKTINEKPNLGGTGGSQETQDKRKTAREDWFKSVETQLDAEAQNYGDIGQKLQFTLTQANNNYNRDVKAISDLQSKWSRTADSIAGNIKG